MATWRDRIGMARFRTAAFHVGEAEREGGRRTVTHEYPLRDRPFVEDLGRQARAFPVDGYVLGPDYMTARDELLAALEEAGTGELVHPYYGTLRVMVQRFRVRESTRDGGLALFSIDFIETEDAPAFPSAAPVSGARVAAGADAAEAAATAEFLAEYDITDLPFAALESLTGAVAAAGEAMSRWLAPVVSGTQYLATLKRGTDALVLDAVSLVRSPLKVLGEFKGVLETLGTAPLTPRLGVAALLEAYGFTSTTPRPPATTATRRQERACYDAVLRLARTLTVVQAARLAPQVDHDSYDAAVALRDAIVAKVEEQAELAGDEGYPALSQLRADLVRAVPGEAADLPRLVRYTPSHTLPSLVLAHRLYGDLALEADLVTRNAVVRPGFVVGGAELEVLSRA